MASPPQSPLVAALPPATDYMTYLTLLEYQLTPQNLPTLNRLLTEDDGKLAEEIGWDLLRLILPLLELNPDEANRCLEIVARRGNPREVVVRVAEELEKLGDQGDDAEESDDFDPEDDGDEDHLPTFAGEAPPVHLGTMTLQGMPEVKQPAETVPPGDEDLGTTEPSSSSAKALKLQALCNMLGILHPRIKTQFPSRFLATSLPAALGAYRQIPISTATTSSFLATLESLSGKKRPPLPPRVSSAIVNTTASIGHHQGPAATPAPLPDPEAKAEEEETGVKVPSEEENSIVFRLLAAVVLEVLDEYLSSLATQTNPSMSWVARLRESLEPQRVLPGTATETQLWKETEELKQRDALLARFLTVAKDMDLHASIEMKKMVHDEDDLEDPHQGKEEDPSEYPTSPSQIPFPRAGVIFLHAYESYLNSADASPVLSTTELSKLIAHAFPLSATATIPSPALQDSLLSLLYRHTMPTSERDAPPSPAKFLLLLSTLTQLFNITPWPALRDSAHYIATKLLHAYPEAAIRQQVITQTLQGSTLSTNWAEIEEEPNPEPGIDEETGLTRSTSALQPHPIPLAPPQQLGALKAVGVDWLKDEFAACIRVKTQSQGEAGRDPDGLDLSILAQASSADGKDADKDKDVDSPSLLELLFPKDLPVLSAATMTAPADQDPDLESDASDPFSSFLPDMPFFISTLNLICIMHPHLLTSVPDLKNRVSSHVNSLSTSSKFLLELLQHASSDASAEDAEFLTESRADLFALEDACARARGILENDK